MKSAILRTLIFLELTSLLKLVSDDNKAGLDEENYPQPRLWQIRLVFEMVEKRCCAVYKPECDVSVDESHLLYKGCLA